MSQTDAPFLAPLKPSNATTARVWVTSKPTVLLYASAELVLLVADLAITVVRRVILHVLAQVLVVKVPLLALDVVALLLGAVSMVDLRLVVVDSLLGRRLVTSVVAPTTSLAIARLRP